MKKCSNCSKDIPDTAFHCVFCGAKQGQAQAASPAQKTIMGYSAADLQKMLPNQQGGGQPQQGYPGNPNQQTMMAGGGMPQQGQPARTMMAPGGAPPGGGYQQGMPNQQQTMMAGMGGAPMAPMTPMQQMPMHQQPMMPQQQPMGMPQAPVGQRPQYLASQSAARDMSPSEPWAGSLRLMCILFGLGLLATFAGPARITDGGMDFMWKSLTAGGGFDSSKLWPLYFGIGGLITLMFGLLPVPVAARGLVAALVGVSPFILTFAVGSMAGGSSGAPVQGYQAYMLFGGLVLGSTGLLIRSKYRGAALGRLLALIGCGAVLATFLIPQGGTLPIIGLVKMLGGGGGLGFVHIWSIVLFVAAALGLILSWLPSGTSGGTGLFAWLLILWPFGLVAFGIVQALIDGAPIGEMLKTPMLFYMAIDTLGFSALAAYGLATIFGKSLEA